MRTVAFLSLLVALTASADDTLAHRVAARAGHPEARVVTLQQELKLTAKPLNETIVWCDTLFGQLACSVEVGANGEWTSQEFLPQLNGVEGAPVGARWWLPQARTLNAIHQGTDIVPPRRTRGVEPKYTPEARKARVFGIVIVEVIIDTTGRVVAARILKALPFGLSQAAIDCVKQWRFTPAMRHGRAIPVFYNLTVNFRLDSAANGGKE
ncbi:MAG TPA: energy transducer TonB [Thermoanaerobaculia bacterium]|nr:energy transducer TonB [Thermoanaerobaculia bacterium]